MNTVTEKFQRLIGRINDNGSIPELILLTSSELLRNTPYEIRELTIRPDNIFRRINFTLGDYNFLQIELDEQRFSMPVHVTISLSILDRDKITSWMDQLGYTRK